MIEESKEEGEMKLASVAGSLLDDVLNPLKACFVSKDEIVDLLGITLVAGENLFLLGPPGTAKSAIVRELSQRIGGVSFEYLLTRFTEPSELFGPFDIRKLRDGMLEVNTEGMLPEATFVFLDELLNANSAILNSLLNVLHERVMRRGREVRKLPLMCAVGASNHLPEDQALSALFDRFLLRARCGYADEARLSEVLDAGWKLESGERVVSDAKLDIEELRWMQGEIAKVDLSAIISPLVDLIQRIREAGLPFSDRRAVKIQRVIAASSLICSRYEANISDLWVMRHIWDNEEQIEMLRALVDNLLDSESGNESESEEEAEAHPGAGIEDAPDPEAIAKLLEGMESYVSGEVSAAELSALKDQLSAISARVDWISNEMSREHLRKRVEELWQKLN